MAELQDTDKFLVNRSGNSYQLKKETLMAELRDDDLMLVNRAGVSYKATGAEIKDSLTPDEEAPEINAVALTEIANGYRYTDKEFPYTVEMTADGNPPPTYAVKAKLSGTTFNFAVESDTITKVESAGENVYSTDTIASVDNSDQQFPEGQLNSSGPVGDSNTAVVEVDFTDAFTAAGITGIQGIALYKGFSNSLALYVNLIWIQLNLMPYLLTLNFMERHLHRLTLGFRAIKSYAQTNDDNTDQNGFYWFSSDLVDVTGKTISFHIQDYNVIENTIQVLAQDGLWYNLLNNTRTPPPNPNTTLTFPTDNNFDKFEVGEVVGVDVTGGNTWQQHLDNGATVFDSSYSRRRLSNCNNPDATSRGDILTYGMNPTSGPTGLGSCSI